MSQFPQHQAAILTAFGISLRYIAPDHKDKEPVCYAHQDDYYIFVVVESGMCNFLVDFKECHSSAGEIMLIQPGQVHHFIDSERLTGLALMVDAGLVSQDNKRIFDEFAFIASSVRPDEPVRKQLRRIADIIRERMSLPQESCGQQIIRSLAEAFVGIIAESAQEVCHGRSVCVSRRQTEITLSFRSLLTREMHHSRQPSYYASKLHISTVYLNEAVRSVTGMSVSRYIRNEIALQAKRLLIHTNDSVKEIAAALGFDDYAYFSRLFTQAVGVSPMVFRQKNLG